jgi:mRNA interferase MazF
LGIVEIARGDIVLMVVPSDLGRPRPGVVLQGNKFTGGLSTIFICPVSSDLQAGLSLRPLIEVAAESGRLWLRSAVTAFGGSLAASTLKRPNNSIAHYFWSSGWRRHRRPPLSRHPHLDRRLRIDHHCGFAKQNSTRGRESR